MANQVAEKNYVDHQIIRFDGKDSFVEILKGTFSIDKVALGFVTYDNKAAAGNKKKDEITVFISLPEFLQLAQDMKSGRLSHLAKTALADMEKGGYSYAKPIFTLLGGVGVKKLAQQGKTRPDGKALSRQFKITPGSKSPWMLSAEIGPGEETDKGLIAPKYVNGRPEKIIRIPLSDEHFKQLFLITEKYIEGYITAKLMMEMQNAAK